MTMVMIKVCSTYLGELYEGDH